jgi:deazaflavin-dependent oxidoreductase (nitroreductase family)
MAAKEIPKPDFMDEAEWDLLVKTRTPEIIRIGSRAHVQTYLESNGEGNTYLTQGGPTLLLATTGRKSGEEHISPANFMQEGEDVIVVGSIAGLERHPHWALNLEAKPEGWVQVKARRWEVTARKVLGVEREQLWPRLTEYFPLWGHFQKYSDREFFVFILSPKKA